MATVFEFAPTGTITNGAAVPASGPPSGFNNVSGLIYDTGVKFLDLTASAKAISSNSSQYGEQVLGTPVTTRYFSRVYRASAFTSGTFTALLRLRNASNVAQGEVRINSSGQLVIRDDVAGTSLATSTTTIPANTPFRFEFDMVGTSGTLRIYTTPDSTTVTETLGPVTGTWGSIGSIQDGSVLTTGAINTYLMYAADGSTSNPGLSRWSLGIKEYVTYGGVRTLLSTKRA